MTDNISRRKPAMDARQPVFPEVKLLHDSTAEPICPSAPSALTETKTIASLFSGLFNATRRHARIIRLKPDARASRTDSPQSRNHFRSQQTIRGSFATIQHICTPLKTNETSVSPHTVHWSASIREPSLFERQVDQGQLHRTHETRAPKTPQAIHVEGRLPVSRLFGNSSVSDGIREDQAIRESGAHRAVVSDRRSMSAKLRCCYGYFVYEFFEFNASRMRSSH